ncbi:MAG: GFA family protein [Alphaproteobacteria bacterium]|jgi:hypothetical protein
MTRQHEGGCLCKAVRYQTSEPAKFSSLCHCRSCQRATGSPVAGFVGVNAENFVVLAGELAIYKSSPGVRRGFCRKCGTSLTFEGAPWPGETHIFTATLDDPTALPPGVHTMMADNIDWFITDDDLTQRSGFGSNP